VSTWAAERYTLNTLNLCNANKCSENRKNQKNPEETQSGSSECNGIGFVNRGG